MDEISANLSAFHARGGKLTVTQGWVNPYSAASWPLEQLRQIENYFGKDVSDWFEVFMVPGGGHCGWGVYPQAPTNYRSLGKLVQWVEQGRTPKEMLSKEPANGTNTTRKLCPWHSTAQYVGGMSVSELHTLVGPFDRGGGSSRDINIGGNLTDKVMYLGMCQVNTES